MLKTDGVSWLTNIFANVKNSHTHTHTHTHTHMHTPMHTHAHPCTPLSTHTHACTHTHTHTCTHTHTHTRAHTCTHTHLKKRTTNTNACTVADAHHRELQTAEITLIGKCRVMSSCFWLVGLHQCNVPFLDRDSPLVSHPAPSLHKRLLRNRGYRGWTRD